MDKEILIKILEELEPFWQPAKSLLVLCKYGNPTSGVWTHISKIIGENIKKVKDKKTRNLLQKAKEKIDEIYLKEKMNQEKEEKELEEMEKEIMSL